MRSALTISWWMLQRDLIAIKRRVSASMLEALAWPIRSSVIYGYILVTAGLAANYGSFYLVGTVASVTVFRLVYLVAAFFDDLEGPRCVEFDLITPMPTAMVFMRRTLAWTLESFLLCLPILPLGVLFLWRRIDDLQVDPVRYIILLLSANFMIACCVLWIGGWFQPNRMYGKIGGLWGRYIHTAWIFGCLYFPWRVLYSSYPWIARLNLINPVTYIMEGLRAAALGQSGYLSYSYCLMMIWIFSCIFAVHGIFLLRRRLDIP